MSVDTRHPTAYFLELNCVRIKHTQPHITNTGQVHIIIYTTNLPLQHIRYLSFTNNPKIFPYKNTILVH